MNVDDMDYQLPVDEDHKQEHRQDPFAAFGSGSFAAGHVARPPGATIPDNSVYKRWVCVYPLYLDADKSLLEGRKVSKQLSVNSPRAYEIHFATQNLGLSTVLELNKCHPADFMNPGRVRVCLFDERGIPVSGVIKSRRQLLQRLSAAIQAVRGNKTLMSKIPPFVGPGTTVAEIAAVTGQQSVIPAFLGAGQDKSKSSSTEIAAAPKQAAPLKKKGKKGRR